MTLDKIKYGYSKPTSWAEGEITHTIKHIPYNDVPEFYNEVIVPYGRKLQRHSLNQIIPGLPGYHVVVLFTSDDKAACPESHGQKIRETAATYFHYKVKDQKRNIGAAVSVEMCYHSYQNPRNERISRQVIRTFHKK